MVIYYTHLFQSIFEKYLSGEYVTDKEIQRFDKLIEWTNNEKDGVNL